MSGMADILVVYNDDADVWYRYIMEHLGKEQYNLRLQAVTDIQLLSWMNSVSSEDLSEAVTSLPTGSPGSGSGMHRLKDASKSKAFIVIASPGHIRILFENPVFNYGMLISDPQRAQILLWGVDDSDLYHPPSMLSGRFPHLDQWTRVSPNRPDYLLTNAVIMIETFGTPPTQQQQQPISGASLTYDVPPRMSPRPRTLPFQSKNKLKLHSAATVDFCSPSDSLKRKNKATFQDNIPQSPAPPLPSAGMKLNHDNGIHYDSGKQRQVATLTRSANLKNKDFRIQPVSARCEEPTTMFVFFDEVVADTAGDARLEVTVGDLGDKLSAEWINPYTFTFVAPVHTEGLVQLKFILDGHDIGMRPLVFYSLTSNIITGISQIYIEQIRSLLSALLRPESTALDRRGTHSLTRQTTVGSATNTATSRAWSATEVDQLMTKLFTEDSMEQIPVQAFEQIFGVYNQVDSATPMQYECPTLVHLAASFDLRELTARLIDLPDARLACGVKNSSGLRSEEVARQRGHFQLAKFLENFRLVDENFDVSQEVTSSTTDFADEPDGLNVTRGSSSSGKVVDETESFYMDMSVYSANSLTRTKGTRGKPVPPLPQSVKVATAVLSAREVVRNNDDDDDDNEDGTDYEKIDRRTHVVQRSTSVTTSTSSIKSHQFELLPRQKNIVGRRPAPEPPQHTPSDHIDDSDDEGDYVEKSEFEKIQQQEMQRQIGVKRSTSDISPSLSTRTSAFETRNPFRLTAPEPTSHDAKDTETVGKDGDTSDYMMQDTLVQGDDKSDFQTIPKLSNDNEDTESNGNSSRDHQAICLKRAMSDTPQTTQPPSNVIYDEPRRRTTGCWNASDSNLDDVRLPATVPPESDSIVEIESMTAIFASTPIKDSTCDSQLPHQLSPDEGVSDLPYTNATTEIPTVSGTSECDGHPAEQLSTGDNALKPDEADNNNNNNNNPESRDVQRYPLHIELVAGVPTPLDEKVISHSQLELVDIMRRVKDNELTLDSAVQLFSGWKERNKQGLTRSFKEKKVQLEKIRREIEQSATTEKPSGSGSGTKIKSKRSFSKMLSFSKKGAHPSTGDMSPPSSAPILCMPLSQPKMKKAQNARCGKPMLNSAIPEDGQLVHVDATSGLNLSGRGVLPQLQLASVQRSSSSSNSSGNSRDSCHSEVSQTSGVADVDANTDDDEVHLRQTKRLLDASSGLTSLMLNRRSKNLEMLVKDLRESSSPPPPPIPPRNVQRHAPEAASLTAACSSMLHVSTDRHLPRSAGTTPHSDNHQLGSGSASASPGRAANQLHHPIPSNEQTSLSCGMTPRVGEVDDSLDRYDRPRGPQLPPRNASTTNMATLEKSVSFEHSGGQLAIDIPSSRKGSLPGDVHLGLGRSSPQTTAALDIPASNHSRQLMTSPDDEDVHQSWQRAMSPCSGRPLPPLPSRPK